MLLDDDRPGAMAERAEHNRRGTFAFTAESRLLAALGRTTYAFMCLRWEALWLHATLTGGPDTEANALAHLPGGVLSLRLQTAVATHPEDGLHTELTEWVNAFAAAADLHDDVLRAHPGPDSLWALPTDTPERLTLADRPEDLLGYAHRFETLALMGASLRRSVVAA